MQLLRKLSMDLKGLILGTETSHISQIQMLWNHLTETLVNAECYSDLTRHCLEFAGPCNHLIHQYPINKVCELDRLCLRCASISDHCHLVPSISDVKINNRNYVSTQSQAPHVHDLVWLKKQDEEVVYIFCMDVSDAKVCCLTHVACPIIMYLCS